MTISGVNESTKKFGMGHTTFFGNARILKATLAVTSPNLNQFTGLLSYANFWSVPGRKMLVKCVSMFALVGQRWKVIPLMDESSREGDGGDVIDDTDTDNLPGNKLDG